MQRFMHMKADADIVNDAKDWEARIEGGKERHRDTPRKLNEHCP